MAIYIYKIVFFVKEKKSKLEGTLEMLEGIGRKQMKILSNSNNRPFLYQSPGLGSLP